MKDYRTIQQLMKELISTSNYSDAVKAKMLNAILYKDKLNIIAVNILFAKTRAERCARANNPKAVDAGRHELLRIAFNGVALDD